MRVTAEIADRLRRPVPAGLGVVPMSLPIVSFGDPDVADVATLALSPSSLEFLAPDGAWLLGDERRVASLVSLGIDDSTAMSDAQVEQTVAESYGYFRGPNWYRTWFGWLETLLGTTGGWSYLDGTACHLDLVQWATRPAQGELPHASWERLVEDDREFLRWQLANSNVSTVLLNGRSVMDWIQRVGLVQGVEESDLWFPTAEGEGRLHVYRGMSDGIRFVG